MDLARGIADCHRKFGWPALDQVLQTRLLCCDRLLELPETTPPLTLDELRRFFHDQARSLVRRDNKNGG